MMIKEVAEEVGVHLPPSAAPSPANTPTRRKASSSCATSSPKPCKDRPGGGTPLLLLKRKVKKMIEEEDRAHPLTDEQITALLQAKGIKSPGARSPNTAKT